MDSTGYLIAAVVAVAVLGAVWFGVRFWLASTRPADIKDVQTPALDRLNRRALERAAVERDDAEEDEDEVEFDDEDGDDEVPKGLTDVIPEERK